MNEIITLDYGSGGKKTAKLIEQTILPKLDNPALRALGDGAVVPGGTELAFSTDSFVVDPLFLDSPISWSGSTVFPLSNEIS